jgi:hypothetical protein
MVASFPCLRLKSDIGAIYQECLKSPDSGRWPSQLALVSYAIAAKVGNEFKVSMV